MSHSKRWAGKSCAEIAHPWTPSCLHAYRSMVFDSAIGSLKLLAPLLFINHGLALWKKKKKPDRTAFRNLLIDVVRCTAVGPCLSVGTLFGNCVIRYILGWYTYSTLAFIPAILSGFISINIMDSNMKSQILIPYSNTTLESIALIISDFEQFNGNIETLFFMVTNACLMYAFKVSGSNHRGYTWFFKPDKKCPDQDEKLFLETVFKKTCYYFGLGLSFGIIRMLLGDISILKPKNMHKMFKMRPLIPGIFAGSYVVLYETIIYAMNRYFQKDRPVYALPAGFLAGLSYAIDPNLAINVSAFINLIQILYYMADIQLLSTSLMESIIFSLCYGTIVHLTLLQPKYIAKLGFKIVHMCCGKKTDHMIASFKKYND